MKYIIEDWASNRLFPDKEFTDFQEAWCFVYSKFDEDELEDIYVLPVSL